MKIGICNDHAGVEYKKKLMKMLRERGIEVVNYGTDTEVSCDYPDFAHRLAEAVEGGEVDLGIALCGTGNGMAITLNKHQGIRAGLAWCSEVGRLVKAHNNANVLVLPARFIPYRIASNIVRTWLDTAFEGGRHQRRIDKMPCRGVFSSLLPGRSCPTTSQTTPTASSFPSINRTDGPRLMSSGRLSSRLSGTSARRT